MPDIAADVREGGAARLHVATPIMLLSGLSAKGAVATQVGYDEHSFAYRDLEGVKASPACSCLHAQCAGGPCMMHDCLAGMHVKKLNRHLCNHAMPAG